MSEKLWHLKHCELFANVEHDEIARLEAHSRVRSFPANSPIYLPADDSEAVFLLTSGRAKVCHLTDDGKQSILGFIEPGELFGELAIFDLGQRDEYVETIEPASVVMIPSQEIRRIMAQNATMALGITKIIGLRRKRIERRLKNLLFLSNRERLVHLLLDLVEDYGVVTGDGMELSIRVSHQDLASIIGSTRETVTVVLGKLQAQQLLRIRRRRIILLDVQRLARGVDRAAPRPGKRSNFAPSPNTDVAPGYAF